MYALVTNGLLRKSLAVVRSLGRHGIESVVADQTRFTPAAWSRFAVNSTSYPNPVNNPETFLDWLVEELKSYRCDVLYPMDDDVMDVVVEAQSEILGLTHVAVPNPSAYWTLRRKHTALEAAKRNQFAVPDTHILRLGDSFPKRLELARSWILKPTTQSGSRGFTFMKSNPEDTDKHLATWMDVYKEGLLQAYIPPGERIDVCLLLDRDSQPVATFVQREVRHFPINHGPSTLQESIHDDELVQQCVKFAQSLGWVGILEMEFMRHATTGDLYFMEANTRFWNSLYLAHLCGVDFAYLYYLVSLGVSCPPVVDYTNGIRCRNLLPTDTLHFLTNPHRWMMSPSFFAGRKSGVFDDMIDVSDLGPLVGFALASGRYLFNPAMWRAVLHRS